MEVAHYLKPKTLKEAHDALLQSPRNVLLAGGLWLKRSTPSVETLIDLDELGLDKIEDEGDYVKIGAMTTLRQLELDPLIKNLQEGLIVKAISQIVGVAFRNSATIGGSVAGRYSFSDILTPLLVLETKLVFYPKEEMSLQDFLNLKGKLNSILTHIVIKKTRGLSFFKKVKITAIDFPILNVAISEENKKVKIAVGSRPAVSALAQRAAKLVNNASEITDAICKEASQIAVEELIFNSSVTASEEYRKLLAKTYIYRGLKEVLK
ncbi:MAG: FAD binding domain-containing protein [Bacilli bacterium]|jgi:CO/xanthine dehydrogenase FAD-binding subunit|nr:FAD binding domain-containing protein [Bacilli bacterium]